MQRFRTTKEPRETNPAGWFIPRTRRACRATDHLTGSDIAYNVKPIFPSDSSKQAVAHKFRGDNLLMLVKSPTAVAEYLSWHSDRLISSAQYRVVVLANACEKVCKEHAGRYTHWS